MARDPFNANQPYRAPVRNSSMFGPMRRTAEQVQQDKAAIGASPQGTVRKAALDAQQAAAAAKQAEIAARPANSMAPAAWREQIANQREGIDVAELKGANGVTRRAMFTEAERQAGREADAARAGLTPTQIDTSGGGTGAVGARIANPYAMKAEDSRRMEMESAMRKFGRGSPSMRRAIMDKYQSGAGDEAAMQRAQLDANTTMASTRETNAARMAEGQLDRQSREAVATARKGKEGKELSEKDIQDMMIKHAKETREGDEYENTRTAQLEGVYADRRKELIAAGKAPGEADEILSAEMRGTHGGAEAERTPTGQAGRRRVAESLAEAANKPLPLFNIMGLGDDSVPNSRWGQRKIDPLDIDDLDGVKFEDPNFLRRLGGAQRKMTYTNKDGEVEGRYLGEEAEELERRIRLQRRGN